VNPDPVQLLSAALLAASRAAAFLREQEGRMKPEDWTRKGRADYVTEVDREAERMITADLTAAFPGSEVLGEELNPERLSDAPRPTSHAPIVWIVDPLDGTTNFLHRFPIYAVSIAATQNGELLAGTVIHVPLDVRYTATRGGGAFQDDARLAVSPNEDPRHALIGTGIPYRDLLQWPLYAKQLQAVASGSAGIRRPGSAALDLCDVAAGRCEGFWEMRLAPWDVAAGALIVREAGGRVTDFEGADDVLRHTSVVAGNLPVHSWLLDTLRDL
jgi:myo-inositol-1(or 4)-monophosphatase